MTDEKAQAQARIIEILRHNLVLAEAGDILALGVVVVLADDIHTHTEALHKSGHHLTAGIKYLEADWIDELIKAREEFDMNEGAKARLNG